jgi:hypothetical protein
MKSALLYVAALCLATTHADEVGRVIAQVVDFLTAHASVLLR